MIDWQSLVAPGVVLIASVVGGVAFAAWRDWRAARSLPEVQAGRRVVVPVTVDHEGKLVRGRSLRDGDDVRILAGRHHLVVPRGVIGEAALRRSRFDDELFEFAELRGFLDEDGGRYLVGPPQEWVPTFEASLEAPQGPASWPHRLLAATPLKAVAIAALAVLAAAVFQTIWWSGHAVSATLDQVVPNPDGGTCAVHWTDGARPEHAEVDCYEPYAPVGSQVRVRALAWPFDESAMDYEGTFEGLTSLTVGPAALALLVGLGVAVRRTRRPAVHLRPDLTSPSPPPLPVGDHVGARALPLRELASAVSAREGWDRDVTLEPGHQPSWQPLLTAATSAQWWPVVVLLGAAWLPEWWPPSVRVALTAGAAAALVWATWRALTTLLAVRRPYGQPVTSEWDYLVVRTYDDDWMVFLLLGQTPHWAVLLGEEHPAPSGRAGVRGDLEEGGAVHLRITGHFWVPVSPVLRMDDEFLQDVRTDLVERLLGEEADPEEEADEPHTVIS